ncbi:type 4a pilus biogenesis protein PilO [Armatimonas sp.]|uniref:type 4a pilus biogenesis protein PilO n=1 Tax=Armatimonas sp. TaxID=1872638 RepID=UPI00375224A6
MFNPTAGGLRNISFQPGKQSAIIMGALTGGLLFLTGGLYVWQSGEIARVDKEVAAKLEQVYDNERSAKQLDQVHLEAAAVDGKLRFLEQNVSSGDYIPTMVQQMAKRAQSYSLIVTNSRHSIEIVPPPQPLSKEEKAAGKKLALPPAYNKARIEIDLTGTYNNVARFIHSLTRFEKIIAVNSVMEQSRQDKANSSPDLSVRIVMTGYVFPDGDMIASKKQETKFGSISERRAMENQLLSPPSPQPK